MMRVEPLVTPSRLNAKAIVCSFRKERGLGKLHAV